MPLGGVLGTKQLPSAMRYLRCAHQIMAHSKHRRVWCYLKSSHVASLTLSIHPVAHSPINSISNAFCSEALSNRHMANENVSPAVSNTLLKLSKGMVVVAISASSWSIVSVKWRPQSRIKHWATGPFSVTVGAAFYHWQSMFGFFVSFESFKYCTSLILLSLFYGRGNKLRAIEWPSQDHTHS